MIHRLEKIYEGDSLRGPVSNLASMLSTVDGNITDVIIFCPGVTLGTTIFNVRINGIVMFAGGARPTLAPTTTSVAKTGLSTAVLLGDQIRLNVESVGELGMGSPITMIVLIDDGVVELLASDIDTDGTLAANSDAKVASQKATKTYANTKIPLSYLDTDTSLAANSDMKVASQKAVKAYADALIGANDAMVFKGVIDCSANPNYPAADRGHTYKISVAGKLGGGAGPSVEVGDTLLCITDGTATGNHATVGANWDIVQVNIDGAVTGPASSTGDNFATFNGSSGKTVKDSGLALDTDGTLAANSDTKIPSQKAVKTYVTAHSGTGGANLGIVNAMVQGAFLN